MKFEKTDVWGFEHAIRGMRNPLESWGRSDSKWKGFCTECNDWVDESCSYDACFNCCDQIKEFFIGKNDLELMQKLIKAGSEHRKFMRQIMVSVDITAPLYWWKEFDTYKIGTVANSTSTMHKLASKPITMDCFEMGDFADCELDDLLIGDVVKIGYTYTISKIWEGLIKTLETLRQEYLATKDKIYWKELIRLLPESWLQTRTVTMNYENIFNMIHQRENHKLTEWSVNYIEWANSLPYSKELLYIERGGK